MKKLTTLLCVLAAYNFSAAHANVLVNPGFENGWQGWQRIDPRQQALEIVDKSFNGIGAAQISSTDGYFVQAVTVKKNTNYELRASVRGAGILGAKVDKSLFVEKSDKSKKWKEIKVVFNSRNQQQIAVFAQLNQGKKTTFDDFSLTAVIGDAVVNSSAIKLGDSGLSPDLTPGQNFELNDWYLSVPTDEDRDGKSDIIWEKELMSGFTHDKYFYTAPDGGLVMMAPLNGAPTRAGLKYTRTELREMLRRGNTSIRAKSRGSSTTKNNWVLSTAPRFVQEQAGGVDGGLTATLAINHVTVSGKKEHVGKVIIGQIGAHKRSPLRLFYRKLPDHKKGSFYVVHQPLNEGEDQYFDVIGSRADDASEPQNGIALGEKFSFEIMASGHAATVAIFKAGKKLGAAKVYLTQGGYDSRETHLYFRLGVNNRNVSANDDDYVMATYYAFDNTHVGYAY